MKTNGILRRLRALTSYSLICAGSIAASQAAPPTTPNKVVAQFDTDTTGSIVQEWNNPATNPPAPSFTWDATANTSTPLAANNAGSGSLNFAVTWPALDTAAEVTFSFPLGANLNLTNYLDLSFDIRFDSDCTTDGHGSYGKFAAGYVPSSAGWFSETFSTGYTSATANGNGWIHVVIPLNYPASDAGSVSRIGFKLTQNRTGYSLVGTTHFHLDNIILNGFNQPLSVVTTSTAEASGKDWTDSTACSWSDGLAASASPASTYEVLGAGARSLAELEWDVPRRRAATGWQMGNL